MNNPFSSINTAGLLLPLDLLTRVGSMDRSLPGMTPADYHVAGSIRLNEAATAAYSRALAYWKSFRKKFDALPASDTGTTLTRDEWLLPLFDCLGYGRLQTKRAISIDSKDYPISHGWEDHVPIHLLSARLPLDKRTQNVSGAATRSPYSLVQELLNRSGKHRWGFVSNGLKFYVLRDNASLTRSANVEFDLEAMMEGEYHADFTALFLTCHQSRLEIQPTAIVDSKGSGKKAAKPTKAKKSASQVREKSSKYALAIDEDISDESELEEDEEAIEIEEPTRLGPENCWLEAWTKLAGEQGTRAKERLRDGVQLAIQTFGAGFYTCPSNAALHQRLRSGELSTQDYYRQLLRLVYRLLMLMVAEDKHTESGQNLLHPIDTPAHIRDRYAKFYGIARIRKLANERRGTPHRDLYESLKTTFLKLREGYEPLGIPGIGSFLFSGTATPDLDNAQITNEALLDAFRNLCFTEDATGRGGSVRRAVDFGNLGSEELGSIYESLLELHPEIDSQNGPFVLRTAAGNERKTSGSYYTPTSLINCLLDSALDPVVNHAIDIPDRDEAKRRLLNLKVCDPACGSGHFLIAAANRMALHLARLETQDTEPTTLQIQHAKRQIIGRCIYGVDINEMAVELCKVSLWMEALEPGKPFSFLENHIKCGNSLFGATPRLLNEGIPDEAFKQIEGDDKAVCAELKKTNKRERSEYKSGQGYLFEPTYKLGNIAAEFAKLTAADDGSLDAIAEKEKQYEELLKGAPYLNARFWADTWCAAFTWKKEDTDLGVLCPTERKFRDIERQPRNVAPHVRVEIEELRDQYQFFHWHLAFPDVFELRANDDNFQDGQAGWEGGFDVVCGNPPWEAADLLEKEFFATSAPEIAEAPTTDRRKELIELLPKTSPNLWEAWVYAKRRHKGNAHFWNNSGLFPTCSIGKLNTYRLFAEMCVNLISPTGMTGLVLKSGIITGVDGQAFVRSLLEPGRVSIVIDFINTELIFEDVVANERFCLFNVGGNKRVGMKAVYAFTLTNVEQLTNEDRFFSLSPSELRCINPNDVSVPPITSRKDKAIVLAVHKRHTAIVDDGRKHNPWSIRYCQGHLNSSTGSSEFSDYTYERIVAGGGTFTIGARAAVGANKLLPYYEGKLLASLNHRFGTFEGVPESARFGIKAEANSPTLQQLQDPFYEVHPRYWIPENVANDLYDKKQTLNGWVFAFRDVCRAVVDARTIQGCILPLTPCNHKSPFFAFDAQASTAAKSALAVSTSWASFVLDYILRQKIAGATLTKGIAYQLPIPSPEELNRSTLRETHYSFLLNRGLALEYSSWSNAAWAVAIGYDGPPFRWDEDRRFQIRCEVDAAYFHLYLGTRSEWGNGNAKDKSEDVNQNLLEMFASPRDAVSYIMDTFPIVRRKEEAKYGEYRTKRVIFEIYDQMTEIIEANEVIRVANPDKSEEELRPLFRSYQSPLNPPPGPPTDANGNFIPMSEWDPTNWPSHIHPPKDDSLGIAVFRKPEQWGLRGDPYLWREIHQKLIDEGMPTDEQQFAQRVEAAFAELTGGTLNRDDTVFVARYNHGGMSSGHVDPTWWRNGGIPLLRNQFRAARGGRP